jgi:exopolysaccharide production protein ExoQ
MPGRNARMSNTPMRSADPGRLGTNTRVFDKYSIIPILACVYATIISPLMIVNCSLNDSVCLFEPRPENKLFWPALAAISIVLVIHGRSRLKLPPHIICLFAYLAFAGASVLWAFKPELSFIRFAQQVMVVTSVVLPALLATRAADLVRGLFLCFAIAAILNLGFVFGRPPIDFKFATWGYPGYFSGKNYLGEFATVALLLSLHEALSRGMRRVLGIVVALISIALLVLSNSKTSMALAVLTPILAAATLLIRKLTRISPAILVLSVPLGFAVLSMVTGFSVNRLSNILYGDPTFTGRTIIWDFAHLEIARRPLIGWGYQSFWLVGPDAPSILEAPGWVKNMPNAHNGYLDTILEMGYVGFLLLLAFIATTLHGIGRMADRDFVRAWLVLSLALHIIITNGLESLWMRGFEMLWIVFLIVAAEVGRNWQTSAAGFRPKRPRPVIPRWPPVRSRPMAAQ